MYNLAQDEQYAVEISDAIINLINENGYLKDFKGEGGYLTNFFEGYLIAGSILYQKLTSNSLSNIEFSQLMNNLGIQLLLKEKDKEFAEKLNESEEVHIDSEEDTEVCECDVNEPDEGEFPDTFGDCDCCESECEECPVEAPNEEITN